MQHRSLTFCVVQSFSTTFPYRVELYGVNNWHSCIALLRVKALCYGSLASRLTGLCHEQLPRLILSHSSKKHRRCQNQNENVYGKSKLL